jgi:VCBS repeat-containing protein
LKFNFKKTIVRGLLSLSVLAGSLVSAIPVSANAASLSIADQNIENIATTFTVDINITTDVPTPGTQVSIAWDPAKLDLQSRSFTDNVYDTWFADYYSAHPETSAQIQNMNGSLNQSAGTLTGMASSILGDVGGPTPNNGRLVRLTFLRQVVNAEVEIAIQTDAKVKDMDNANIPLTTDNGVITVGTPVAEVPPVAQNVTATTSKNTAVTVTMVATDANGDVITYSIVTSPAGSLGSISGNQVIYTPVSGFTGTDTFTYKASDDDGDSNNATATITVGNAAPVAVNDSYSMTEDGSLEIAAPGVLTNDSDADSDPLTAILTTNVSSGILSLNADGSFSYDPVDDFNGTVTFTYKANDGVSDSDAATVNLTVNPDNDAPVASDSSVDVNVNVTKTVTLTATDVDGDSLSYIIKSLPVNGDLYNGTTIITAADYTLTGTLSYTPDTDYTGNDSFTFVANDSTIDSNTATITIDVTSGAIDVDGTKNDYITFTAPEGAIEWDFVADDTTTVPYNDGVGAFSNTNLDMGVFANTPWKVQIKTTTGYAGHMTKWNGTYDNDTYLTDALQIDATGTVNHENWITLTGSEQTVASTEMSDYNTTSTYDLDFDLNFYQYVNFCDPGLPDGYSYHTVVQFTCVPTTY